MFAWLRLHCLGIADDNASVARRGFVCRSQEMRDRLEEIGRTFLAGYRASLADSRPARLAARLDAQPGELHGFAYEGAAMGLALLDALRLPAAAPCRIRREPAARHISHGICRRILQPCRHRCRPGERLSGCNPDIFPKIRISRSRELCRVSLQMGPARSKKLIVFNGLIIWHGLCRTN